MNQPSLRVGQQAIFRGLDGRVVSDTVFVVLECGVYLVIGDHGHCGTYADGLYRFQEQQVVARS